jgi:hypothetical protein
MLELLQPSANLQKIRSKGETIIRSAKAAHVQDLTGTMPANAKRVADLKPLIAGTDPGSKLQICILSSEMAAVVPPRG